METGIVITTHNAEKHLPHCLPPLLASPLKPHILIVDASSTDGTLDLAKSFGVDTWQIPRENFNHGLTREAARKKINMPISVMMTPDAYASPDMLEYLTAPLQAGTASLTYARQLPRPTADPLEAFSRLFNYPTISHERTFESRTTYGIYTPFFSNSCAAYLNSALDAVGGFPSVLIGEDTAVAAKLLQKGHTLSYVAEATVHHSHSYTLLQEFQRYFDTGLARKELEPLLAPFGKDKTRGWQYHKALCHHLRKNHPQLLPYAFLQSGAKWLAYHLGKLSANKNVPWKRLFSAQKFYWENRSLEVHRTKDTP